MDVPVVIRRRHWIRVKTMCPEGAMDGRRNWTEIPGWSLLGGKTTMFEGFSFAYRFSIVGGLPVGCRWIADGWPNAEYA